MEEMNSLSGSMLCIEMICLVLWRKCGLSNKFKGDARLNQCYKLCIADRCLDLLQVSCAQLMY